MMALVLSSCSHDDSQVNNGWVINATWATKEEFDKAPVVGYIIEGVGLVFTDRGGHEVNA